MCVYVCEFTNKSMFASKIEMPKAIFSNSSSISNLFPNEIKGNLVSTNSISQRLWNIPIF